MGPHSAGIDTINDHTIISFARFHTKMQLFPIASTIPWNINGALFFHNGFPPQKTKKRAVSCVSRSSNLKQPLIFSQVVQDLENDPLRKRSIVLDARSKR